MIQYDTNPVHTNGSVWLATTLSAKFIIMQWYMYVLILVTSIITLYNGTVLTQCVYGSLNTESW